MKLWVLVCVTALAIGLVLYLSIHSDDECTASGGHKVTTGYMPVVVGKAIIMDPIVECEH